MYARKWPLPVYLYSRLCLGRINEGEWIRKIDEIKTLQHWTSYWTFNSIVSAATVREWCQSNCTKSSYKNVVDVVKKTPFLKKSLLLLEGILEHFRLTLINYVLSFIHTYFGHSSIATFINQCMHSHIVRSFITPVYTHPLTLSFTHSFIHSFIIHSFI